MAAGKAFDLEGNEFRVGDRALHLSNRLDSRKVTAVRKNEIKLFILASETDWLPSANYLKVM